MLQIFQKATEFVDVAVGAKPASGGIGMAFWNRVLGGKGPTPPGP